MVAKLIDFALRLFANLCCDYLVIEQMVVYVLLIVNRYAFAGIFIRVSHVNISSQMSL